MGARVFVVAFYKDNYITASAPCQSQWLQSRVEELPSIKGGFLFSCGGYYAKKSKKRFTIIYKLVDFGSGYIIIVEMTKNVTNYTIYCGRIYQKIREIDKELT